MTKVAALLLALLTVALVARLDRDGILAHTDFVTRALGVELRIDVMVHRSASPPVVPVVPVVPVAPVVPRAPSCE